MEKTGIERTRGREREKVAMRERDGGKRMREKVWRSEGGKERALPASSSIIFNSGKLSLLIL